MAYQQLRRDVIRHELGHWVASRLQGFTTGAIRVFDDHASAELDLVVPALSDAGDIVAYIRRRITVLYAGMIAESLLSETDIDAKKVEHLRETTSSDDYGKIKELLRVWGGMRVTVGANPIDFQNVVQGLEIEIANETAAMIVANAKAIRAAAWEFDKRLKARNTNLLEPVEVEQFLKERGLHLT